MTTDWKGNHPPGEEVIRMIRAETDTIMLAFSRGKDSTGAWLALRDHFPRIEPFYMYKVPNMDFIDRSLRYYETFFKVPHIHRIPHSTLYRHLTDYLFQPPEYVPIIDDCEFGIPDFEELSALLKDNLGLPRNTWVANGVRACDSLIRRTALNKWGPINFDRRTFMPIWDWNKARLLEELHRAQVRLPYDYALFGRTFDGTDYRFLKPIKEHLPADWARILEIYPLAEVEILRRKYAGQDTLETPAGAPAKAGRNGRRSWRPKRRF